MRKRRTLSGRGWLVLGGFVLILAWVGVAGACNGAKGPATPSEPTATATAPLSGATPTVTPTPVPLKLLKTDPEKGPVGTRFTLSGEGLPPGKKVEFFWRTVEGSYKTEIVKNRVVFRERVFSPARVPLGTATADAQGKVTATFSVPEDYGEIHDVYAAVEGQDVAKGGFFVTRSFELSPPSGPVGTPVTLTVKGLGPGPFNSTMGLRYDNKYTGWISATVTKGTAKAQFRAAGPVGKHLIEAIPASHLTPYINVEQSPVSHLIPYRAWFEVTGDRGTPANTLDWPDIERVNRSSAIPRTTIGLANLAAPNARVTLVPDTGPIESSVALEATGLQAGAVNLEWVTVTGNDLFGWNLFQEPLGQATVGQDGSLKASVKIPHSLGGWHAIWVTQGDKLLTEAPFFVQRSLLEVTPARVKAGEIFKVQIKGVGWTELDNGVSVVYDNAFIGYACGFSSQGDVTLWLAATGGPGTHLIDLYPMIYDSGYPGWPWQYNMPQLTALEDHPSLGLGYRLPIYRLAIEVVE